MLNIEIALGLLIVGFILIKYNAYLKKINILTSKKKGRENFLDEAKEIIDKNYQAKFDNYLKLFEKRLLTLEDEKDVNFKDIGVIEYDLFVENTNKLKDKINITLYESIYSIIDANSLSTVKPHLDQYVENLIGVVNNKAMVMLTRKLLDINERNKSFNKKLME